MSKSFMLSFLLVALLPPPTMAHSWRLSHKFVGPISLYGYGESVAVSRNGNAALVSSMNEPCAAGLNCGAVYAYEKGTRGWRQVARLTASDETPDAGFGGWEFHDKTIALSADGRTALVGLKVSFGSRTGAVYVFARDDLGWHEQQKLALPDGLLPGPRSSEFNDFGASVALSGDGTMAVVGAPYEGMSEEQGGAVYVFTRQGKQWTPLARLTGSRAAATPGSFRSGAVGSSVALSGDGHTLLAGSLGFPTDLQEAYLFRLKDGRWTEQSVFNPIDKGTDSGYGNSVALSRWGDTALIGAQYSASAYVVQFDRRDGSWKQTAKLGANITDRNRLGFSTALDDSGAVALAGDWTLGSAFAFRRAKNDNSTHRLPQRIITNNLGGLGSSVALTGDGETALVGYDFDASVSCPRPDGSSGACPVVYVLSHQQESEGPARRMP